MKIRPLWIVLGVGAVLLIWMISVYNGLVSADEKVNEKFNEIQTQMQRRFDLVPELVATVDMNAENEKEILTKVTQYRAGISDAKTPADIEKLDGLGTEIKTAFALNVEAYPNLKSPDAFRDLQAQLEGTENRIAKSRSDFNEQVKNYNTRVRRFPNNLFNAMYGFEIKEGFKAEQGSEKAVDVRKEFGK